ncbi:MAG: 1-acyl-sn-glycerol-3-phosphate acyltransferase [Bacteroidia bacterium]
MIYLLIRPFVLVALHVYYRINIRGLENVPRDQPVVLAPNHVNGFVDPIVIAMYLPQKVRFFARGDVFKGAFAKWILNQMSVSPMFRIQEGYSEIKKNDKSFEECRQLLTDDKTILLFPEALCVSERRLRPLKKGLARIVFQTGEAIDFKKDILVVPIGLNYQDPTRFRSRISIDIGKPVSVLEHIGDFKGDKVKTINRFTKMLEEKMYGHVSAIINPENDKLVSHLEEIYTHQWLKDKNADTKDQELRYRASREMIDMVNRIDEQKPEMVVPLKAKLEKYTDALHAHGLRDHLLREENVSRMNIKSFILEYAIIFLGMPVYGLGLLMNFPPYYFIRKFSDRKVKKPEFYASFRSYLSLMAWQAYMLIQLLIVGILTNSWLFISVYGLSIILSGAYVLRFYPVMRKIFGRWKLLRMVRKEREKVEELVAFRSSAMAAIADAKSEYLKLS